jgi:urate oxidase
LLPVTTGSIVDGTFTVASTDVIKDIQVYDLAGRLLQNYTTINEVQFTAPFNHAAGLYIAHVSYESGLGSGLKLIHVRN